MLPESAVISEFLNERYPEPPLWPDDPGERAAGRLLVFRFDDFSKPYYAFRRGEEGARERFEEELGFLDGLLEGPPWLSGRAFGLADVAFLPWVVRARDMLGISLDPWPALAAWLEPCVPSGRRSPPSSSSWPRCDPVERRHARGGRPPPGRRGYVVLDVRSTREFTGEVAAPCDPRPGRIPGARHFDLQELLAFTPEADPRAARAARGVGARHLLPLRLALRARRRDPALARLPGVELPRLLARVVAGRVAAGRGRLDGGEEGRAEPAAEVVPDVDPLARRLAKRLRVGDVVRVFAEPRLDLRCPDLGVELDAPRLARAGTPAVQTRLRASSTAPAGSSWV